MTSSGAGSGLMAKFNRLALRSPHFQARMLRPVGHDVLERPPHQVLVHIHVATTAFFSRRIVRKKSEPSKPSLHPSLRGTRWNVSAGISSAQTNVQFPAELPNLRRCPARRCKSCHLDGRADSQVIEMRGKHDALTRKRGIAPGALPHVRAA